jgi:hypothetical protein
MDEPETSPAGTPASKQSEAPGTAQHDTVPADPLRELAAAWAKDPKAEPAGKPAGEKPAAKDAPLKSFNDLAGKLGMKLEDLYKLEVADSKTGKKYTVEGLKGLLAEQDDHTVRSLQFEEKVRCKEADFTRAELELREQLASLPPDAIKPEALAKIRQSLNGKITLERQRTLEAIPEWADETVRTTELKGIVEHLEGYGLPAHFLLKNYEAGAVRFVRDSWKRAESIRKALESVAERKTPTPGTSKVRDKPAKPAAVSPSTSYDRAVSDFGNAIAAAAASRQR